MIVRRLRPDENNKLLTVQSIAFNFSANLEEEAKHTINSEVLGAFKDDNETVMATIFPNHYESNYCGEFYPCVGIGGVATLPEYRRSGAVREIFSEIFRLAPERNWITSYLYPFSCNYYRQFGYERVMQLVTVKVPISDLAHTERNTNACLYQGDKTLRADIVKIYNNFILKYNAAFRQSEDNMINLTDTPHKDKRYTYVWFDENNEAKSFATFRIESDTLKILNLCYDSCKSLNGIIGFLRMYEGQVDDIEFEGLPETSEVNYLFREHNNCEYHHYNKGMGRALIIGSLLKYNKYPLESGHFSLKVNDYLDYNRYIFDVEYADGKAEVTKRDHDDLNYDIECGVPSLSRIIYGSDSLSLDRLSYMPDIDINNKEGTEMFVKAFPKRPLLLWQGF